MTLINWKYFSGSTTENKSRRVLFKGLTFSPWGGFGYLEHDYVQEFIERYGGSWSEKEYSTSITYVLITPTEFEKLSISKKEEFLQSTRIRLISPSWIFDSITAGELLPEEKYLIGGAESARHYVPDIPQLDLKDQSEDVVLNPSAKSGLSLTHIVLLDLLFVRIEIEKGTSINDYHHIQILRQDSGRWTRNSYAVWEEWGRLSSEGITYPSTKLTNSLTPHSATTRTRLICDYLVRANGYFNVVRDFSKSPAPNVHDCQGFKALTDLILPAPKSNTQPKTPPEKSKSIHPLLPFGALGLSTLQAGKKTLDSIVHKVKGSKKRPSEAYTLEMMKLISQYYSIIPRQLTLGKDLPLLHEDSALCDVELKRLDSWIANYPNEMLFTINPPPEHACQVHLDTLGLGALDALSASTAEYKEIDNYFQETLYSRKLKIIHIYRVTRKGEAERWQKAGWHNQTGESENRQLLWHGSPVENFHLILKNGLSIYGILPEVYFSDTAETSLYYANKATVTNTTSTPVRLMLLCEVQLGRRHESRLYGHRKNGNLNFQWIDAGVIHPDLKGVKMADTRPSVRPPVWQHVEYMVRDVTRIRHRYLIMFKP